MVTNETGQDPKLPPDARLDSLDERIERLQREEAKRTRRPQPDPTIQIWQRMFSHLIGAPAGGGIVGWGLDSLFGTFPWLLLLMLFLGFGVGVVNVMRLSRTPPGNGPGANA
jgi:ATP synthase protein I